MFSLFSKSFDDELQKISANKLMKQIQQGKLSPQENQWMPSPQVCDPV